MIPTCPGWVAALIVLALPMRTSEPELGSEFAKIAPPTSLDEALARLPCIGREYERSDTEDGWIKHPVSAWLESYLDAGGTMSDANWQLALERGGVIRLRERWPASEPLAVSVRAPAWLPRAEIRLRPRRHGFREVSGGATRPSHCGSAALGALYDDRYQVLGSLPLGGHVLDFDVEVVSGPSQAQLDAVRGSRWFEVKRSVRAMWRGWIAHEVEIVEEFESVLPGAHDPGRDAAVRSLLIPSVHERDGSLTVSVASPDFPGAELATTAVALELELLRHGSLVESKLLRIEGPPRAWVWSGVQFQLPVGDLDPSLWSIRVRGSREDALRFWDATQRWDGEFEIPLSELPRR